jgi:hypothetical protein
MVPFGNYIPLIFTSPKKNQKSLTNRQFSSFFFHKKFIFILYHINNLLLLLFKQTIYNKTLYQTIESEQLKHGFVVKSAHDITKGTTILNHTYLVKKEKQRISLDIIFLTNAPKGTTFGAFAPLDVGRRVADAKVKAAYLLLDPTAFFNGCCNFTIKT